MKIIIEKASELGFCFGVRRAIKIIQEAARELDGIMTLGPIVHNRLVVNKLADIGVNVLSSLDQIQGKAIAITSHGISPELLLKIKLFSKFNIHSDARKAKFFFISKLTFIESILVRCNTYVK